MKLQIVPLDVAKDLKELGFNWEVPNAYFGDEFFINEMALQGEYDTTVELDEFDENWNQQNWVFRKDGSKCFGCNLDNKNYFEAYSAPSQSLAVKWFRDVHGLSIEIQTPDGSKGKWSFSVHKPYKFGNYISSNFEGETYEETELEGIRAAIKYLKNEM